MAEVGGISLPITAEAGQANKELNSVTASLERIENALSGIQKSLEPLSGATQSVSRAVNRLAKDIETIHPDKFQKVSDSLKTVADTATKAQDKLSTIGDGVEASTEKSSRAINSLQRDLTKALTDMGATSQNIGQLGNVGNAAFEALADYIGHSREETTALVPVISQVTQEAEKFQQAVQNAFNMDIGGSSFDVLQKQLPAVISSIEQIGERATQEAEKFQQAVQNAFKMDIGGSSFDVLQRQLPAVISSIEQIGERATQTEQKLTGMFERPLHTAEEFSASIKESMDVGDTIPNLGEAFTEDTARAISRIQQLYAEADHFRKLISQIRAGKIFTTDEQYRELSFQLKEVEDEIKQYEKSIYEAIDVEEKLSNETGSTTKAKQWSDVIAEVEKLKGDFDLLSKSIGDANAEMQILVDARNMLKKAFSDTDSGKMLWDNENMRKATAMLKDAEDRINIVKKSMADPAKLEIDVTEPINSIEKLYARLRDLNSYISDMKGNKINFADEEFINAIKEREKIQKRINEIEGKGGGNGKQEKDSLRFLAKIVGIQHELEKVSSLFGRMGDIAKNAFLKALTPLKLIQHEFEEMKSNIVRVGSGFAMVSKWILKIYSGFDGLRKKIQQTFSVKAIFGKFVSGATKAFNELSKRWKKVADRFTFTLLRMSINEVIRQLGDATKSLALFSSEIGTNFNSSMSIVTSDVRYLAASIIALLEPLINYFTPILDGLVDQLVNVVNHVNMFVAALTGAKSFTIAKKKIIDYSKALDKANKSAKMLTLGIDELNILNDDKSTEELEDLFEWQELPTPQIDFGFLDGEIVDLIKRIIQQIKELLKAIVNAIKEAWRRVADYVLSALKRLVKAILTLFSDILRDLTKLFNEEATIKLFETIFRIIGDIANVLATIVEKIDEAWNYNNLGLKILEKIRDILLVIVTHVQHVTEYMKEWAERLSFIPLFEAFLQLLTQVEYAIDQIGYVFEDLSKLILDLMEYVLEKALPEIIRFQSDIIEGIGNIAKNIHEAWTELDYGTTLFNDITAVIDTLLEHIRNVGEEFKSWTVELDFKPVMKSFDGILQSIEPLTDALGNVFEDMFSTVLLPLVQYVLEEAAPKIMDVIADIIKGFANLTDGIHKAWQELSFGEKVVKGVSDIVSTLLDYLEKAGQAFKRWAAEVDFKPLMKGFDELLKAMQPVADFVGGTLSHVFEAFLKYVQHLVEEIFPEWEEVIAHIANATDWKNLEDIFNSLVDAGEHLLEAIGGGVVKAVENLGVAVGRFTSSKAFNDFIENLTNFVNRIDGDMVAKVLTAIGEAILKIAEVVMNFANSKLVQDFLNSLLDFVNNSSTQKLANILLDIAKAFLAFKGLSAVAGGLSSVMAIIPGLVELGKILSPTGALIVGIGAAVAAFALFGDTIRSIDWSKLARDFAEGVLELIEKIDWVKVGETFGYLLAEFVEYAITTVFNPAFQLHMASIMLKAILSAILGVVNGIKESIVGIFSEVGGNIIDGLIQGIGNALSGIWESIKSIFQSIIDFVKGIFGIQSPSTVFAEIGVNLVLGLIQGITETWGLLIAFFQTAFDAVYEAFNTAWNFIKDTLVTAWQEIVSIGTEIWTGFKDFIITIWETVQEVFTLVWDTLAAYLTELWTFITELGVNLWGNLRDFILNVWSSLQEAAETAWNFINDLLTTIWNSLNELAQAVFGGIHDLIVNSWEFIKQLADTVWNFIKNLVIEVWNAIQATITEVVGVIQDLIKSAWEFIQSITHSVWSEIKQFLESLWNSIKDTAETIFNAIQEFLNSLWNGIKEAWEAIWNAIKSTLEAVWNAILEAAHTVFEAAAEFLSGLWDFLVDVWGSVWNEIKSLVETIWNTIKSIAEEVWGAIVSFFEGLWDGVKNIVAGIAEKFKDTLKTAIDFAKEFVQTGIKAAADFANAIWDGLKDLASKVFDIGKNIAEGVWNGLKDGWTWLKNQVANLAGELVDKVKDFLGIHSPSKVFADEVGKWIPPGIAVGFEKSMPGLLTRMEKAVGSMTGIRIPQLAIPAYANGGFPEDGLFMMNHNEMYGKFANGRTGVVNNKMMEETMRDAVVNGLVPYLDQIAQNTQATTEAVYSKELQIGDRAIAQSSNRGQSQIGRTLTKRN